MYIALAKDDSKLINILSCAKTDTFATSPFSPYAASSAVSRSYEGLSVKSISPNHPFKGDFNELRNYHYSKNALTKRLDTSNSDEGINPTLNSLSYISDDEESFSPIKSAKNLISAQKPIADIFSSKISSNSSKSNKGRSFSTGHIDLGIASRDMFDLKKSFELPPPIKIPKNTEVRHFYNDSIGNVPSTISDSGTAPSSEADSAAGKKLKVTKRIRKVAGRIISFVVPKNSTNSTELSPMLSMNNHEVKN